MVAVTVTGANGQTVSLQFDSSANAALAKTLSAQLHSAIAANLLIPASSTDGPPPPLPPGKIGEYVQQTAGAAFLTPGYRAYIGAASSMTVFGSGDANESILAGSGNLTFTAFAGSGTLVAGGGTTDIFLGAGDTGNWTIDTGKGTARIIDQGSGNNSIAAGGGANTIALGSGNDTVESTGHDTIQAGAGAATIIAGEGATDVVYAGSGKMFFVGGEGAATVFAGSGSSTLLGGDGTSEFHGGTAGNNLLIAGSGAATLFGGGNGDLLMAGGSEGQLLYAAAGAETLSSAFSAGADTLVAGAGNTTMIGGVGHDFFSFINGNAGGHVTIFDFTRNDLVGLTGYAANALPTLIANQTNAGGSTTVTLSDKTTITFVGIGHLNAANFAVLGKDSTESGSGGLRIGHES